MKKIDIYETKSLKFVKGRIAQLMIGQTRKGRALVYQSAADSVLESLFGFRRFASHVGAAETPDDMRYFLRKIDAEALFEILRYKDSYSLLAKLVILKNKLDEGEIDTKEDRKKLSSAYKKAIKRFIHDYDIRNGNENDFNDILEFVGKSSSGYSSLFDDDGDYGYNRSRRRGNDLSSLFELSDDDRDYDRRRDRYDDGYEDDIDEFERFLGTSEPKRSKRRQRRQREEIDLDDIDDDDDDDEFDMTEARMAAMETAINTVAKSVQTLTNTVATAPVYQPTPPPEPKPKRREKPIGIPKAAPQSPQSVSDTAKILKAINTMTSEMNDFKLATVDTLSEAFERIDEVASRIGIEFDDNGEEGTDAQTGTFVRSSESPPPDVTEEDISSAIDNALQP